MSFLSRIIISTLFVSVSNTVSAIALTDALIPTPLKESYNLRQQAPLKCVDMVTGYIHNTENIIPSLENKETGVVNVPQKEPSNIATQLLASCYIALEDYQKSLSLLMPLLKNPSVTVDEIRTLDLIATEIPESERPKLSNETLINMMRNSLEVIQKEDSNNNLINILNLSIAQLAIETHEYQIVNQSLDATKERIKGTNNQILFAWLAYFYGHYYNEVNQQQLAISHFRTANALAEELHLIKLNSLIKQSLSELYQQKHRYKRALHFAGQRVELLLTTENYVQKADSLIKFAVLKRQNEEFNQSLIYLFNALELVENKHQQLVAETYLELGRTYAATPTDLNKNANFAQKYLQNARALFKQQHKLQQETESILLLAQLNIRHNDTGLAILQLEEVLTLAEDKFPSLSVKAFELLALSYELSGDHEQANFHFKNFHSLQNAIKERLFALQQLKIDEQFHLIEQTQQQIQLEIENNQLLMRNNRFQSIAYIVIILLLLSLMMIFHTVMRNRKLTEAKDKIHQQLQLHPRTKLPLHQILLEEETEKLQYQGRPLFYSLVHVPFLSNLNESKGLFTAEKIESKLGESLQNNFSSYTRVTQVKDNQLLFITEQEHCKEAEVFAQKITRFFNAFAEDYALNGQVSCGVVAFPFLNNACRAVAPERMLNLTSLALFGACQIREKVNESSWLELYAIEKIQPAFFDGDLWLLGQTGIDKGIVKLKTSHPDTTIVWPELDR